VAIETNKAAFLWGRRAAVDPARVAELAQPPRALPVSRQLSTTLDELIARRTDFLVDYQSEAWARRYRALVDRVREVEEGLRGITRRGPQPLGELPFTEAVARNFGKLMSYKDEYEVARLYTSGDFLKRVADQFEGDIRLHFHLAPPLLAKRNEQGELVKRRYGPWMFSAFRLLARFKGLRGTAFDPFGYTAERRAERALIDQFERDVLGLVGRLDMGRLPLAIEIAELPQKIRGFGHVKERAMQSCASQRSELLQRFDQLPLSAGRLGASSAAVA
jgi:indolepyruvate ferredoxin oxidoreductase